MMLLSPGLWWASLGVDSAFELGNIPAGYFLGSFSMLVAIEAALYLMLPVDLIPDWIPLLGRLVWTGSRSGSLKGGWI